MIIMESKNLIGSAARAYGQGAVGPSTGVPGPANRRRSIASIPTW